MSQTAQYWIDHLQMTKHPEGGYFKEVYRSEDKILSSALPTLYGGDRSYATSIYFLLAGNDFSAFHRLQSDEIWHFYAGCGVKIVVIDTDGKVVTHSLGNNFDIGEQFQVIVPANTWFGAKPIDKGGFALVGCTMAPGFEFEDFELADRTDLINQYPQHKALITEFTRIR